MKDLWVTARLNAGMNGELVGLIGRTGHARVHLRRQLHRLAQVRSLSLSLSLSITASRPARHRAGKLGPHLLRAVGPKAWSGGFARGLAYAATGARQQADNLFRISHASAPEASARE